MKLERLKNKITAGNFGTSIIGLGYVGLPLAVEFAKNGINATGIETNRKKIASIRRGKSYIPDINSEEIKQLVKKSLLKASDNFNELKKADVIIICVPTPLRKSKDPDVSYIVAACHQIKKHIRKKHIIILESTTYPGTTQEVVKPLLEESGLKAGSDFFLAFSPERVDPGNKTYKIKNTPKVVGGIDKISTHLAAAVYSKIAQTVITVSNTETAEMVKLLENTFRAVNIAMINEFALMANKLNLDIWEIIKAAASKPFGFMPFYPGPGIGGHCIPLDPHYLAWKMKTLNFEPRFIELANTVNSAMPEYVVNRISDLLNRHGKALSTSKILIVGMAYKADITDDRESPAKDVFALLTRKKGKVKYYDPYINATDIAGKLYQSVPFTEKELKKYDCVVVITPHSAIDYKSLMKHSNLVFDARNIIKVKNSKLEKL